MFEREATFAARHGAPGCSTPPGEPGEPDAGATRRSNGAPPLHAAERHLMNLDGDEYA
jgi:hypothetical protein